jgi:lipopolysaccharide transport system ATP-binding protein
MLARLAFAAATAVEADVLLMDEWISVGDAEFQVLAQQRLEAMAERAGILVLASHDPEMLRRYCNKVLRLDHGVSSGVMDIDALDALLAQPQGERDAAAAMPHAGGRLERPQVEPAAGAR